MKSCLTCNRSLLDDAICPVCHPDASIQELMQERDRQKFLASKQDVFAADHQAVQQGRQIDWSMVCWSLLVCIVMVTCSVNRDTNSRDNKTDGIFESATQKINNGRASELTFQEKQRLHDVLHRCKISGKPIRLCTDPSHRHD